MTFSVQAKERYGKPALVKAILEIRGNQVLLAHNGEEALRVARNHRGIRLPLSDVMMPEMTGIRLAELVLRKIDPNIGVVLMSGHEAGLLIIEDGWDFIAKPFMPDGPRRARARVLRTYLLNVLILSDYDPYILMRARPREA